MLESPIICPDKGCRSPSIGSLRATARDLFPISGLGFDLQRDPFEALYSDNELIPRSNQMTTASNEIHDDMNE